MRKHNNVSKKSMIAILSAAMMIGSVIMPVTEPVVVYAETVFSNSNTIIGQYDSYDVNTGDGNTNFGSIGVNHGEDIYNFKNAVITTNASDGTIGRNGDRIGSDNNATITTNNGIVNSNESGLNANGTPNNSGVRTNNGTINTNADTGYVDINNGTITTNEGRVRMNNSADAPDNPDSTPGKVVTNNGMVETNQGLVVTNDAGLDGTGNDNGMGVRYNRGTITTNTANGLVYGNQGILTTNNGMVVTNLQGFAGVESGKIVTNNGYVQSNHGVIETNNEFDGVNSIGGYVRENNTDGKIKVNKGNVGNNGVIDENYGDVVSGSGKVICQYDGSVFETNDIENMYGGQVVNGNGTQQTGTITNYFGGSIASGYRGTITNNYTDVNTNAGDAIKNAANQFRSVSFIASQNSTGSYGDDFTNKDLKNTDGTDADTKYYVNVTGGNGTGTITIRPEQGYEIKYSGEGSGNITGEQNAYTFRYALNKQADGSYVLYITEYNGNSSVLSADMFGLVIQAVKQANGGDDKDNGNNDKVNETPQIIVKYVDDTDYEITYSADESAPATGNVSRTAQISTMINGALAANPNATVLDLYFGNDPSFDNEAVVALCKINIAKRCHFTHNGKKYVLFIPVVNTGSKLFEQCLSSIDQENGKQAGPLRLAQLFAPVDFVGSEE